MKRWFASCTVFVSAVLFFSYHVFAQAVLYEKGLRAYEKKDYRSAVKHLKEYVSRKPDANAEAYYLLGYADYMVKRKAGKAVKGPVGRFRDDGVLQTGLSHRPHCLCQNHLYEERAPVRRASA